MDIPGHQKSSTFYDTEFNRIENLAWLPWVGGSFSQRPPDKRLLLVGESRCFTGSTPKELQVKREECLNPNYTRKIILQILYYDDWTARTLEKIPELLFKARTNEIDRHRLWGDTAFYNFVQRPMNYTEGERPERKEFVAGWPVFKEVVRIIQPSHCLFIGVKAADYVPYNIRPTEKVAGVLAKSETLEVAGRSTQMIFVHHLGRCKNVDLWHDYLVNHHPDLMGWLTTEGYQEGQAN